MFTYSHHERDNLEQLSQNKIYLFILAVIPFHLSEDETTTGWVVIGGEEYHVAYKRVLQGVDFTEVVAEIEIETDSPLEARQKRGDFTEMSLTPYWFYAYTAFEIELLEVRSEIALERAKMSHALDKFKHRMEFTEAAILPCRIEEFCPDKCIRRIMFNSHDVDSKYENDAELCAALVKEKSFKIKCEAERVGDFVIVTGE